MQAVQAEEAWLQRSQAILQALEGQPRPDWLTGQSEQLDVKRQAQQVLDASQAIRTNVLSTGSKSHLPINPSSKPLTLLFVSFSLSESALKSIFEEASGRDDVLLVFRGPKPGQKLPALMADLKRLLKGIEPLPNIIIDPTRFQRWSVSSVPDIVVEQDGKARLHARGVSSLPWLDEQIKAGKQGDLGALGDVGEITEIDLLEEIKHRMAAIDWKHKQQQAIARFWAQQKFEDLPTAQADRDRTVDLTITAPRDLTAPNGQMIVRAGQTVNPLAKMPFGLCLMVFDATVPAQVELIRHQSCQDKQARVMYLATQLSREAGWEDLKNLETLLKSPVYLLTPDVRRRFQLQQVPAIVEQAGNCLLVRERKLPASTGERS
ncbi:TrbC family F-type conjugative pilus assembly protein [Methylomonas rapida]|uniref:TrbC family F-type conjugative pilus assembly protein n=1 Tax=Methylomonas rapida TaxID=2963939 RepID=A0ABY7GGF7_9GAMM|nr:TrbC family F-type conjugative pilus assembly protein [Methylomonas rapida]WAR43316.1 TrbC family F-type conjugative pilus assembly protein [Methylomonas rapida]WAR43550.1 TrbC family F-type conjugative pilus assembly protein [Methylomonas rapida]